MLDEEYINRSLLDSLDAQADAEPISSSSDSDAPIATASSFQTPASSNSTNTIFPSYLKSAPHHPESYNPSQNTTTNSSQSMYNGMSNISTLQSEFSIPSAEHDSLNQHKLNGFGSVPSFRNSASFQPFSHPRQRGSNPPYRDTTNFTAQPYATPPDIFIPNMPHIPSQSQQQAPSHPFDTIHPPRQFDFSLGGSQPTSAIVSNGQIKPGPFDSYRIGMDSTLSQSHLGKQQNPNTGPPGLRDPQQGQLPHQAQNSSQGFQGTHHGVNGIPAHVHGHHGPMGQNQIPFGPSLQTVGGGSIPLTNSVSQGNGVGASTGPASMTHLNGTSQNPQQQQQEEISTIFVVGFPDDMQEREFQNMFTFSPGFEAATLKIPNKDLTAYGTPGGIPGVAARAAGLPLHYAGSNDPYNLVTVNQGGVVVDGGRDGLTSSWPAPQMQAGQEDGSHFMNGGNIAMQPPRKQIIGFAKFRTRQEALEARDTLQGRRVDIEKGSVLKAEMAKKNLHTKRGPGVVPLGSLASVGGVGGVNAAEAIAGLNGLGGMSSALGGPTGEAPFIQREKELGVMGAMGIAGLSQRRDRLGSSAPGLNGEIREDEDRQQQLQRVGVVGHAGLSFGPRGARERAEEEERKRKEKEAVRLRQNSYAFEAFHSVPHQMVHEGANSLLSAENGSMDFGASHSSSAFQQGLVSPTDTTFNNIPACSGASGGPVVGPWGMLREVSASAALRKQSAPVFSQSNNFRPTSPPPPQGTSPPSRDMVPSPTSALNSSPLNGSILANSINTPFSPQSNSSSLPGQVSSESPQPLSPTSEPTPQPEAASASCDKASVSNSSSSSVSGHGDELSRAIGTLAVSTSQGTVSPQLPSPASGASSGTGRNPGDQNPPINTLYVGNLPTSPIPGGSSNYLEDRLRDLFSKQRGYRKLCFRQKSNGPMCFVEFEDVSFAAQAMKDLYGHTLDGLIRNGGIRLSYSKNPLGVRTPTNGNTAISFQQQQQAQSQNNQLPPLGAGHPFFADPFHQRVGEMDTIRSSRRDTTSSGVTSPTSSSSSYHYTMSSQPPRFFSASPPTSSPFGASSFSSISPNLPAAFPRANPLNAQGFGFFSHLGSSTNPGIPSSLLSSSISTSSSSFSPFGSIISAPTSASNTTSSALHSHSAHASSNATIPDQPSADSTIPTANIATATT